jgi:type IV pilus assembly protein PilV
MRIITRHRGFTLLEVLIALLVFSLGLLGMAGLLIVSVKTNHSAYLRTQASFLAQSMADRMRANMPQVWLNAYDTSYPSGGADPCTGGGTCTRANIAIRDKVVWSTQLTDQLPNGAAVIACVPTVGVNVTAQDQKNGAPYAGLCNININWNESSVDRGATGPQRQTFVWVFQP